MEGCQPGEPVLEATLRLLSRDGPAVTVAACLLLKAVFLALHLLALGPPECSGMEKLALLHWSFDVWNVWCLAVFLRTGRLPWSLETCVLYHVLGYLVYSLVYLHLHTRQQAARGGAFSRMTDTPESELTVRVSEEEEEMEVRAGGDPFATPGRAGILSEDVPDEEPVTEDREDGGGREEGSRPADGGERDALNAVPEDDPAPVDGDGRPTTPCDEPKGEEPQHPPAAPGVKDGDRPRQPSPVTERPCRKLDAAVNLSQKSPPESPDSDDHRDITEDVAAALKAGKHRDLPPGALEMDNTGFISRSPEKTGRERTPELGGAVTAPLDLNGREERSTDGGRTARMEVDGSGEGGEIQNGGHGGVDGDRDGVMNGGASGPLDGDTNGHHDREHGERHD